MAEIATNFPPQTYSSSFFLNALTEGDKNISSVVVDKDSGKKTTTSPILDCFITTMFIYLIIITVLTIPYETIEALECVKVMEPKIRTFPTLVKYQANTIPFDCRMAQCQGNWVKFDFLTINKIQRNSFITYQSDFVMKLSLNNKHIESIEKGAFESLYCLHNLDLSHNIINHLKNKNIFDGLYNLHELNLSYNNIEVLDDLIFVRLNQLRILDLSHNKLKNIQTMTFYNLTNLEKLYLNTNQLKNIDSDLFVPTVRLRLLDLSSNYLFDLEPEKLKGLAILDDLNLSNNSLKRFDASNNFKFDDLKYLNLSYNFLSELNVLGLHQNLPHLLSIDINNNRWLCDELSSIITILHEFNIKCEGNNRSDLNKNGITCQENIEAYGDIPDINTAVTEIGIDKNMTITNDTIGLFNKILLYNTKLLTINKNILDTVQFIQILSLLLFIVIVIFITYQMYRKFNCFLDLQRRIVGNDNDGNEHFRLLHAS